MQVANISLSTQDIASNRRFYVDFLGLQLKGDDSKMLVFEGNLVIDAAHGNPTTTGAHIMLLDDALRSWLVVLQISGSSAQKTLGAISR